MGSPKPVYFNTEALAEHRFDAIVIGSGISGGWAAKELCEKGLKTLVIERGRQVEHVKDYSTAFSTPWQFPHGLNNSIQEIEDDPVSAKVYDQGNKHFYVSDREHPYIQDSPFQWIRGYQVGGRSLTWGRQCYRLSDLDFEANERDGHGIDWPIRYRDIEPWYDYVEQFAGISGKAEGLGHLPDGQFLPPIEMNCIEAHFASSVQASYQGRVVTPARVANLTRGWKDRGPCQYRNLCSRGCPFGGYFSSNSATLPAAAATGNLTVVHDAVVTQVLYDDRRQRATGVLVMDAKTKRTTEYFSRIIFLNASTIPSAALLLHSRSPRFPDGLGNDSKQLGRNLMDHFTGYGAYGDYAGLEDKFYYGRKPAGIYLPRFRNISEATRSADYVRGWGFQGVGARKSWEIQGAELKGFGKSFKENLLRPGPWSLWLGGWGETLPYYQNGISLDADKKDQWGLPLVHVYFQYGENEKAMMKDVRQTAEEMLKTAGFHDVEGFGFHQPPGSAIHEMGTMRMGRDPNTSVLNAFNQVHAVKNLFVTDGSCMTSSAWQNPSLTYMALTARACDFAVSQIKSGNL